MAMSTSDKDEAEASVGALYLPNRLEPFGSSSLDFRLDGIRLASVTVGRLSYGADARLTTAEASQYHVNLPISGRAVSRVGAGEAISAEPGQATVFLPGRPAEITWLERCVQVCLMIPRAALESELEQLTGKAVNKPVVLEAAMDLASPIARGWRESLDVVLREFEAGPGLASHPVAGRQLERLIIDGLLLGQRHNYADLVLDAGARATSLTVRRARSALEEEPERDWSAAALAQQVHVSVRTLQHAFAEETGVPPMTYLRRVRLQRANEVLSRTGPGCTTVSDVAYGLGFTHLGRFSAAYRQMFGESPSATLKRS